MANEKYTKEHEWIRVEGDTATVGISAYAQEQLGDVVFVEVPEVGKELAKGDEAAVVESVKAASEIYAPATGTVTAVNEDLAEDPSLVNADAMGQGWFFEMTLDDESELDDLMDQAAYDAYVDSLD